jgi:hypothetical protein
MTIPIVINKKKFKIKPIAELSTTQFIEMSKIENLDAVKYIAWQTEQKFDDAFFAVTSRTVELAIGNAPDITKLKLPKWPDYSKTIQTVGQRHQIESSGLAGFDLLVFILAVSQARSNNIDDVNKLRDEYLQMPFVQVLPAGFFFFQNLQPGKNFAGRSLEILRRLMRIVMSRKKQE